MNGQKGFLLLEILLLAFMITLEGALAFQILSSSMRRSAAASKLLAVAAATEMAFSELTAQSQSLLNPSGAVEDEGDKEETVTLSGTVVTISYKKEVIERWFGLNRWVITAWAEGGEQETFFWEEVRFLGGLYDPF